MGRNSATCRKCNTLKRKFEVVEAACPTKEALTVLVWSKPLALVAADLGIKNSGVVTKWCSRLGVVRPSQGYWTKKLNEGRTPKHGTVSEYNNHGCRCALCRSAVATKTARRRASIKKDRNGAPRGILTHNQPGKSRLL